MQSKLREAVEVARTTRYQQAIYFTEMAYLAVSELIRESAARQLPGDDPRVPNVRQLGKKTARRREEEQASKPSPRDHNWDDN
jgi:hypothetical protein